MTETMTSARVVDLRTDDHEDSWDLIIRPHRGWWDLRLSELWDARELITMFVRRDLLSVYQQTILGPLWHLFQPLLTTITFTVIFGRLAGLPTDGAPVFLFYLGGIVLWSYFAACLTGTANTFIPNAGLFGKVYFPRLAVPISILISRLVTFGIQLGLFLLCVGYYSLRSGNVVVNGGTLVLPLLLVILAGLGLGFGLLITALTTRYRDLQQLVGFGVQLLMYATPVIYPASFVSERYRPYIWANPMTPVMEAFRWAFLGAGSWTPWGLLYSAGVMIVFLVVGLLLFNRAQANFVDVV